MFKKILKLSLLTIFLSLILLFNFDYKTKAYYDWDTSFVNVYIDGKFAFKDLINSLPENSKVPDSCIDYGDGTGTCISYITDGWPTNWTQYGDIDKVTYDSAGKDVCLTYDELYAKIKKQFTYSAAAGIYETDIYLWILPDNGISNFAEITYYMSNGKDIYDDIKIYWNCKYPLTYADFPTKFYNSSTGEDDAVLGGVWINRNDQHTSIDEKFNNFLIGGSYYTFEYYVSYGDFKTDLLKKLALLEIPEVLWPENPYVNLPTSVYSYGIRWSLNSPAEQYVKFGVAQSDTLPLYRIQQISNSVSIKLTASISDFYNGEIVTVSYNFDLVVEAGFIYLETPKITKVSDATEVSSYIEWEKIPKADYYKIYGEMEKGSGFLLLDSTDNLYYKFPGAIPYHGLWTIVITACSNTPEHYLPSSYSNSIVVLSGEAQKLDSPELELVGGHILKWQSNSLANFYNLYQDYKHIKSFPTEQTQFDLYSLNLDPGEYSFRLLSVPIDTANYADSQYSNKITYTEANKELVLNYNFESFKTIPKVTTKDALDKELPAELNLSTGVGFVQKYYLDKAMTQEISKDSIFAYWSNNNYRHLDLYLLVVQPLVYEGPTLIYKNPDSMLSTQKITSIVDSYCKSGTKDSYTLKLVDDGYTGNGDKAGNYTMKYECIVGTYTTNINITIKVTSSVKADYIYNKKWFSDEIISVENVISTAKAVGLLPDVTLNGFNIVSLHNDYKSDYYADKAAFGVYNFLVQYASSSGEEGLVQFEVNYLEPDDWSGQEVAPEFPIGTVVTVVILIAVSIGAIVFVKNFKKTNKYKSKKKF